MCIYVCVCVCACKCVHLHVHVHVTVHTFVSVHMHVCMCVHVHVCVCVRARARVPGLERSRVHELDGRRHVLQHPHPSTPKDAILTAKRRGSAHHIPNDLKRRDSAQSCGGSSPPPPRERAENGARKRAKLGGSTIRRDAMGA